jgi:hypothetical protein
MPATTPSPRRLVNMIPFTIPQETLESLNTTADACIVEGDSATEFTELCRSIVAHIITQALEDNTTQEPDQSTSTNISTTSTFIFFPQLPVEIQILIWKEALPTRCWPAVENQGRFHQHPGSVDWYSHHVRFATLDLDVDPSKASEASKYRYLNTPHFRVCKRARSTALETFNLTEGEDCVEKLLLSYEIDTFVVGIDQSSGFQDREPGAAGDVTKIDLSSIRKIGFIFPIDSLHSSGLLWQAGELLSTPVCPPFEETMSPYHGVFPNHATIWIAFVGLMSFNALEEECAAPFGCVKHMGVEGAPAESWMTPAEGIKYMSFVTWVMEDVVEMWKETARKGRKYNIEVTFQGITFTFVRSGEE